MNSVRVGLTGGIGSGKTTVARQLGDRGAYVIEADAIARDVVAAGTSGLASIVSEFGPGILTAEGDLNRAGLAGIVFSDPAKLARLDAITHPLISARTAGMFASAPPGSVIVHDVALLTELGLAGGYDFVIVVDSPDELRVSRLVDRGVDEQDARRRIAAQASREQRLAVADAVIDNSGDREHLREQVDALWPTLASRLRAKT